MKEDDIINKLRIISGKYKRLLINSPTIKTTRETTDKVRECIFNSLGQYFEGGVALDLFAGSGALGIEAISRGIDQCYFVDINPIAYKTIKGNLEILKVDKSQYEVYKNDYLNMIKYFSKNNIKFDYIFLDPPYNLINNSEVLKILLDYDIININGIVVLEHLKDLEIELHNKFEIVKKKNISIRDILIIERIE